MKTMDATNNTNSIAGEAAAHFPAGYGKEVNQMTISNFLLPVRITRVRRILSARKHSSLVATTFTAVFADGSVKTLTEKSWTLTNLLKPCEIGWQNWALMSADDCPLYRRDWSEVPQEADFRKHYPSLIEG